MPAIEMLLATIQDERRRRIEAARLVRAVTSSRPSMAARLAGRLRARLRWERDAAQSAQPATGAGSAVS